MPPITVPDVFTRAAESFAESIVKSTNESAAKILSDHYGFPFDEGLALLSGGVQLSKEVKILPPNKLPYCGRACLKEGNCKAIVKNGRLFTLCQKKAKDNGYCSTCGKQAAKEGSPKFGDIEARESCDMDKYSVGGDLVMPYWNYMQKHDITEEQANASALVHYGVTIDPVHFKPVTVARGRPATTAMKMGTPLEELHMPEDVAEAAKSAEAEVAAEVAQAAKADEAKASKAKASKAKAGKAKAGKADEVDEANEVNAGKVNAGKADEVDEAKVNADEAKAGKAKAGKADEVDAGKVNADEAKVNAGKAKVEVKAGKAKTLTHIPELEEGELDEEELDEEEVDEDADEEVTADDINSMVMEELQKFAESHGIPITENGKKLPPKKLRKNVCEHLHL